WATEAGFTKASRLYVLMTWTRSRRSVPIVFQVHSRPSTACDPAGRASAFAPHGARKLLIQTSKAALQGQGRLERGGGKLRRHAAAMRGLRDAKLHHSSTKRSPAVRLLV